MALFQETKKSSLTNLMVKSVWPRDRLEFMNVDVEGLAGGLLRIWDPVIFERTECCCSRNFLLLLGKLFNSFDCVLVNIHAPNDIIRKRKFWESLLNLKTYFPKPWCTGGDFNEIRNIGESVGVSLRDRGMKDFNNFINRCEVVDLLLLGRKYTWCNAFDGHKWSRIDRFLLSPEWLEKFKFNQWGLARASSDHCPIVLMEDTRDWGPKPFKFLNAWMLHLNFASFVEHTWSHSQFSGPAGFTLQKKLFALKLALKKWSKEVYGDVSSKLQVIENDLHQLNLKAEIRPLVEEDLKQQREKKNERQNRNSLNSITVGDTIFEEPAQVKKEVWSFFSNHFSEAWKHRTVLVGDFKSVRFSDHFHLLEAEFSKEEVWAAIADCNGNKAPWEQSSWAGWL
ncbi:uncharacterized protein LOC114309162 [Camellia sinensis]|uniref:uncharacterized protein LOC114309162 n=1 Tax=Camellia sinensis TaxID=4442 RepID=UPI001036EAA3|nr:uncharacterized protein LOC114309162 [Camellia sinensis]